MRSTTFNMNTCSKIVKTLVRAFPMGLLVFFLKNSNIANKSKKKKDSQ